MFNLSPSVRRLKALITKEFYQIIKDPSSILISVVLPMILLFVLGFGVSLDMDHLNIAVVMEDSSPTAESLLKSFTDSRYFNVSLVRDRRELEGELIRGKIRGMVIIPAYFSQFMQRPTVKAPIQVIADGSEPNTASFVQNYAAAAFQNWQTQERISKGEKEKPGVKIQERFWFNEELESRNFLLPGSLALVMTLIGTLLTALVVAREWERGTMEALMSTPVTKQELILGKLIPYYFLGMTSMLICFFVSVFLFGVPFRGSFILLLFVSSLFLLASLATGLLISTISKNQFVASQAAMVSAFLPTYMLSGFIFEISSMPAPIRAITYLVPARYFVTSLLTLFLAGNIWRLIIIDSILLFSTAVILFIITLKKTVKRLD